MSKAERLITRSVTIAAVAIVALSFAAFAGLGGCDICMPVTKFVFSLR